MKASIANDNGEAVKVIGEVARRTTRGAVLLAAASEAQRSATKALQKRRTSDGRPHARAPPHRPRSQLPTLVRTSTPLSRGLPPSAGGGSSSGCMKSLAARERPQELRYEAVRGHRRRPASFRVGTVLRQGDRPGRGTVHHWSGRRHPPRAPLLCPALGRLGAGVIDLAGHRRPPLLSILGLVLPCAPSICYPFHQQQRSKRCGLF